MKNQYGAILLAGGRSSRMGQDKAGLELAGQTMPERLLRTLGPIVAEIVVMRTVGQPLLKIASELQECFRIGWDSVEGQGPLRGIADALPLLSAEIDKVFLLTCDLPYLNGNWLQNLRNTLTDEYDLVCTEESQIANPLLALYRRPVLESAPQLLAAGERRPFLLWKGRRVARLPTPEATPWLCQDVNTPQEYQKAQTYFQKRNND